MTGRVSRFRTHPPDTPNVQTARITVVKTTSGRQSALSRFLSSLWHDRRGNVVLIFGLSSFVLMGFVGAAVDFSRVDSVRRAMQDAADLAVLRTMNMNSSTDALRTAAANTAFDQNFTKQDASNITRTLERTVDGKKVNENYVVRANVTSYFGAFFGKDTYPVTVVSKAMTELDTYEIAFVLDTTGSMAQAGKMPNLKSSVDTALASLLSNGVNASNSKVAIVPFNTQVRLSNSTISAMHNLGILQGYSGSCVTDRDHLNNYDVSADPATAGVPLSQYQLRNCDFGNGKEVQGLSTSISSARSFIQTLQPDGNTNITMGVQWGMEALSPNQPFTGAVPFGDTSAQKYMIVVTDGDNTANGWTTNQAQIDARTAKACANAKARGITVFTVKVIEGNSNMLRGCASDPTYFYDLKTASQLNAAMAGIFKSITKTRLTA